MFGGSRFQGYWDHPRQLQSGGGWTSDAAGRYQFLSTTWDEAAIALDLADFSPASQDQAALFLIECRGALKDIDQGRLIEALTKCAWEWASLPGSPYGQPTKTIAQVSSIYSKLLGGA